MSARRLALALGISLLLATACHGGEASSRDRPAAATRTAFAEATASHGDAAAIVASRQADAGLVLRADAADLAGEAAFALAIPARSQAAESPPSGWCGETAIQEGLLHLGMWAPQRLINRAGRPVHPDLYATEMPVALGELGVRFTTYGRGKGYEAFARWVRGALEEGDPVVAGVKILPTAHPEWGLDHFVLVVGHGEKGLLVNTTWGRREWVRDTTTPGLSLANAFWGLRLRGLLLSPGASAARVSLLEEEERTVKLRVVCEGLVKGRSYRMERRSRRQDELPAWSAELTADRDRIEKELVVDAEQPARFQCVLLEDRR